MIPCIARLPDGTLVVVFGRGGQRFMVSYDDGQTWCKAVYLLSDYGEYARSVAVQDDTIVTITAPPGYGGQLHPAFAGIDVFPVLLPDFGIALPKLLLSASINLKAVGFKSSFLSSSDTWYTFVIIFLPFHLVFFLLC